ncbi:MULTISPECIES: Stk1 family PASTA domain-containing Ser/Thr kinase [Nocardioides]|uniref:non-specific serine/threonine protein kinase n=1 Tax=Nocardioides vastitatis TaxID=2568655 RepID=A0ABW0ZBP9_9ACTN|nr:Stk1 family PASTA domain-containing Ser/Thr kinase [Nocardioides sp.]THJ11317.1 Stk1 family PASTA domain-containing Ser/Thr kinase [Nocardioides sp.]
MHRRVAVHNDQRARGGDAAHAGDPAPRRTEDHQTGRLLDGRYLLGSRIARGGMASVYEAVDVRLDRTVAVKIMHPGLGDASTHGDESFARRFVREAKAAARLSHPNVVSVYDQGQDDTGDGTIYLVMEYVSGHTLRDTVAKEAPMAPERALAILDPVLSALASAHRAGLVHRDVKPENVLIADDGRVKVADFGLAKAVSADTQHTATNGVLIGTVSYLAPELVIEQRADARADVYAAGVILYELLTGVKPHTGDTPIAVAYRHVHHDVPEPSALVPHLPAYVDALVARATTRDPSLRPSDAGVLLHHVRRVAHALHEGVREDPELVDDLLPHPRAGAADDRVDPIGHDTTPEPVSSWLFGEERTSVITPLREEPPGHRSPSPSVPAPTDAVDHPPPRRRRRGVVLLLVVALLVGAISAGGYWVGWGRYTTTPSVVGLTQAAAEAKLTTAGLELKVGDEVYSESVAKGEVISTDPRPGARILPEDEVVVVVSLGPERYDVPDLAGLTVAEAEEELAGVKLVVGRLIERYSETVPAGTVIRSEPGFGTAKAKDLPVDTAIRLVVSKGRKPIRVGNWVGKAAEDAEKQLENRGLQVKVIDTEYSDTVDEGDVISQNPDKGTLHRGDTVELVVSKGPELVTVPGVRYLATDEAVEKLQDLGFKVRKRRATIYLSGRVAWDTDPGSGSRARKGSTVILYIV